MLVTLTLTEVADYIRMMLGKQKSTQEKIENVKVALSPESTYQF